MSLVMFAKNVSNERPQQPDQTHPGIMLVPCIAYNLHNSLTFNEKICQHKSLAVSQL